MLQGERGSADVDRSTPLRAGCRGAAVTRSWSIAVAAATLPGTALAADQTLAPLMHVWLVCAYATLAVFAASRVNPWFGLLMSLPPLPFLLEPLLLLRDPGLRAALGADLDIGSGLAYYAAVGIYALGVLVSLATAPLRWWPRRHDGDRS